MTDHTTDKEPILTALLNLFTGGGGYLYIGQTNKGIALILLEFVFAAMSCCLFFLPTGLPEQGMTYVGFCLCGTPLFFAFLIALVAALDGYNLTKRVNEGQVLGPWEFTKSLK